MYIILVIFHVLFEFTENLALGVRLPSHFRPYYLPMSLVYRWDACPNSVTRKKENRKPTRDIRNIVDLKIARRKTISNRSYYGLSHIIKRLKWEKELLVPFINVAINNWCMIHVLETTGIPHNPCMF